MSLDELRKKIDELDARVVALIGERIRLAEDIGREKNAWGKLIVDAGRERLVMEHIRALAHEKNLNPDDFESIYKQVIAASKRVQGAEVAFQGESGAYAEEAAFQFFGTTIQVKPCETLENVFKAVESGEARFGVVPVENSLEGIISRVYDLMLESNLRVCGETELRVSHCLISVFEANLDTIKRVYSHPQALAQSRKFLKHLSVELVPTDNTATSVRLVKEKGTPDSAAIASARAAEIHGMKIIAREIEDNPNNFTRFFILCQQDAPPSGNDKTSIVFSTKDRPGALHEALKAFASRSINLTKLESRPTRQKPWEYNFYLDFAGHREDKKNKEALQELEAISIFVKVLGSYPRAR
ncbi:MAG: prephenate dehydratase [Dehalococcoidales bacterium]|nr:prephenate dehydratase [Dehalococcoidales bacterium]